MRHVSLEDSVGLITSEFSAGMDVRIESSVVIKWLDLARPKAAWFQGDRQLLGLGMVSDNSDFVWKISKRLGFQFTSTHPLTPLFDRSDS